MNTTADYFVAGDWPPVDARPLVAGTPGDNTLTALTALAQRAQQIADQRERAEALGVFQRNEILRQAGTIAELGHRLVECEKQRDEALGGSVRYRAESVRLDAENRGLRETIAKLRRDLTPRVVDRIDEALTSASADA